MRTLWDELVTSRAFWLSYVCAGVDAGRCPSLKVDVETLQTEPSCGASLVFEFPEAHLLRLDISVGEHRLTHLDDDDEDPQLVGTMDCHPMSDLFRWDEFRAIGRRLAGSCEPAWAIELLFSFYVAATPDIADEHAAVLRRSLEASKAFTGPEIEHIVRCTQRAVRRDFRWIDMPGLGWAAEGGYSMRNTRGDFDFPRFARFLAALEAEDDSGP